MRPRFIGWLVLAILWTACTDVMPTELKSPPSAARHTIDPIGTPVQIYGSWHCGNDYCTWAAERDLPIVALRPPSNDIPS